MLKADARFNDGFIAYGFSQGGVIMRHYLEMINDPPVLRFIAQASPLAGQFEPTPVCLNGYFQQIKDDLYSEESYETVSLASWWHDAPDEDNYRA